jgi:hypothetical protein
VSPRCRNLSTEPEGPRVHTHWLKNCALILVLSLAAACPARAQLPSSQNWHLPPAAEQILHDLYSGNTDAALAGAQQIQAETPDAPLGYLLEGEVRWWRIYCSSLEYHYNFLELRRLPHATKDDSDLLLAAKEIEIAEKNLATHETAELHLYAGMGYALRARLMDLHGDHGGTARAGVRAREHFLRALEMDPLLADANFGLGLYNYYVDTLSGIARALRFFMGIPAGNKKEGLRQLENAIASGDLTRIEARYYLAINLRTYDREYGRAAELLEPLVREFPQNPVFTLMLANMNALLNRKEKANALFIAAQTMDISDANCAAHTKDVARIGIERLSAAPEHH